MTVKEAIEILQTKNPDAEIVVLDKEGEYDKDVEIKQIPVKKILWNDNEPHRYFYDSSFIGESNVEVVRISNY